MCPFIILTKPSYHLFSQFIVALQGYKQLLTTKKKKKRRENIIRACISFYLDKRVISKFEMSGFLLIYQILEVLEVKFSIESSTNGNIEKNRHLL